MSWFSGTGLAKALQAVLGNTTVKASVKSGIEAIGQKGLDLLTANAPAMEKEAVDLFTKFFTNLTQNAIVPTAAILTNTPAAKELTAADKAAVAVVTNAT
jgi:ABC-type transporter MlaC component